LSLPKDVANKARQLSKQELFRFNAFAENYGIQTTVVGGWAVYAYSPYLESIDIDVVTTHDTIPNVESILTLQCGWILTTIDTSVWKRFSKRIPDEDPLDNVFFDLLSSNLVNAFHEDNTKRIPFDVCLEENHYVRRSIDSQLNINVPKKELLFLYKLKSYRDRIFDLHNKADNEMERSRLRAKVTKDLSDTIALIDPNYGTLDLMSLKTLVESYNLQFLRSTIEEIPSQAEAIEQYRGTSSAEIQSWILTILPTFQ
jgi:hypothetical protein